MTNDEIIDRLRSTLIFEGAPKISQEKFDEIVDVLIKDDKRELMWRLCGSYLGYNYNKVIDYYITKRDSYYLEELFSFTCGDLDQKYLALELIKTGDKQFIIDTLAECGRTMYYNMDSKALEYLLDYLD